MMQKPHQPMEPVHRSTTRQDCRTHAMVLEAAGIRCSVHGSAGDFAVVVAAADAARARAELGAYASENRDWPAKVESIPQRGSGWVGVCGYASVLVLVAVFEHEWMFAVDWLAAGKTHAGLICDGQWWRTITALTLHSDLAHLAANLIIGGLIGLYAGQVFGSGLAWFSIVIAGAAGNLLNALIRSPVHTSVGASTAVFGALSLVAAYVWKRRRELRVSKLARWAPLAGGAALLGFLGTGGGRTDVAAHLTGFVSGGLIGAVYGTLGDRVLLGAKAQFLLGVGALAVVALAWATAVVPHAPGP